MELRSVFNAKTLNPADTSVDAEGNPNLVSRSEPHDLSMVLSGALYSVMVRLHEKLRKEKAERDGIDEFSASGFALFKASEILKRMIYRALDHLPPGEISFADYGRAILAADQAAHPDDYEVRDWLVEEFVRRGIVPDEDALGVETNFQFEPLSNINLKALAESDWAAYTFADKHRKFLHMPEEISFYVRPRKVVEKRYYTKTGSTLVRELLFKVSWQHTEENPPQIASRFRPQRQIVVGTTLAFDWDTGIIRTLLTTAPSENIVQSASQLKLHRDEYLQQLSSAGRLNFAPLSDDGVVEGSGVLISDGLMVVRGTSRNLHIDIEERQ
jgi:hypothetical protein